MQAELRRSGFEDLVPAGIVLTGGTSKMEGVVELAEEIFHMPVRVGLPQAVTGLTDIVRNPIYSTGVGLLQYGAARQEEGVVRPATARGSSQLGGTRSGLWDRFRSWLQNNF